MLDDCRQNCRYFGLTGKLFDMDLTLVDDLDVKATSIRKQLIDEHPVRCK